MIEITHVSRSSIRDFEKEVEKLLKEGWQANGQPFIFNQAITQQYNKYPKFEPPLLETIEPIELPEPADAMGEIGKIFEELQHGQLQGMMVMHAIMTDKLNEFEDVDAAIDKAIAFVKKLTEKIKAAK